jgi:hypothetical protein
MISCTFSNIQISLQNDRENDRNTTNQNITVSQESIYYQKNSTHRDEVCR